MKYLVLKLNAGNDKNGNPRRGFLVFDTATGQAEDFIDEGFMGYKALEEYGYDHTNHAYAGEIATTPSEYRFLLKKFR